MAKFLRKQNNIVILSSSPWNNQPQATVCVKEVNSMYNNMEKVMPVSKFVYWL